MQRIRMFVLACAVCAVALISVPRIAHAQIVELDAPVTCSQAFVSSADSNPQARYALTNQWNLRTYSWDSGTGTTIDNSSTLHTTYYFQTQIGLGAFCPSPRSSDHGMNSDGSWDMSTHPAIALFYDLYNFGDSNTNLLFVTTRSMAVLHNPTITATNGNTRTISSTNVRRFFYYLPHGADRHDRNAWVYITRNSDGYFHLPGAIDSFAIVLVMEESLTSSSLTFSQWDPEDTYFGVQQVPSCYVSLPDTSLSSLATGQDIANQTTSLTSSINTQTIALGRSVDSSVSSQTDTLMDTSGSSDILSDQVTAVGDDLQSGVFGQFEGVTDDFLDILSTRDSTSLVHFPGIVVQGITLVPEQDVYVWANSWGSSFISLRTPVRVICTFVLFCAWFNGMIYIFHHQILGIDIKSDVSKLNGD